MEGKECETIMGIKDEVVDYISYMISPEEARTPDTKDRALRIADKIDKLYLSAIEGEEGFEPECTDTRHDDRWCPHCSSMAMGIDAFISHLKESINGNKV